MADIRIGVIINGATGRMGTTQHMANLLAIAREGGLPLGNGDMLMIPPGSSDLMRVHGGFVTETEIARVVSWTAARRLAHTNRPAPNSALDAKFSVQYCVARALLHHRGCGQALAALLNELEHMKARA